MYINRDGQRLQHRPTDCIEVPDQTRLSAFYQVLLYAGDEVCSRETFLKYPTEYQVLWCIMKHCADYASIETRYELLTN